MVIAAAERSGAGLSRLRSASPRRILTCLLCESAKVTTSAISAFSAAGCCPALSRAGEPPRTILTALHPVSGKVTSCTLPVLLSIACLTVSTETCGLAFEAASAVHADHSAVPAQKNTAEIPPRIAPSTGARGQKHPQRRHNLT